MDKEKFKNAFKECLPYLVAAIAIVALIGAVCVGYMVKTADSEMDATTEAWRTDMAKSIAMLSAKISAVEKEFDGFRTDFDESIAGAKFEVEDYPVKYAFTEQSAEEFKTFVLSEQLPAMKVAYEMTDEEYEQTVASTVELTPEQIMSSYGMDSVALGIELIDETVARIGGLDGVYNVQDGTIYADGYYFGTIDNDKIIYSQNSYGVPLILNFYREGGESQEMSVVDKINVLESRIRSVSAQLVDFRERMDHYESELNTLTTVADGLRVDLNSAVEEFDALKENVGSMEAFHEEITEFGQNIETRVEDLESFNEEVKAGIEDLKEFITEVYEFPEYVNQGFEEVGAKFQEVGAYVLDLEDRVETLEVYSKALEDSAASMETLVETVDKLSAFVNSVSLEDATIN